MNISLNQKKYESGYVDSIFSRARSSDLDAARVLKGLPSFASLRTPSPTTSGWKALSIFSGCGGLDLGFLQQGIFSQAAHDIDDGALATYQNNLPPVAKKSDLSKTTPVFEGGHVLLAGAPCQGFSTAGKRRIEDPRNALLLRIGDIARENRPKVIIVENVPAAYSGMHRSLWQALENRLRVAGYNVRSIILEGQRCGLAQRRKRLFLLSWLGSDCLNVSIENSSPLTVREALTGIDQENSNEIEWPKDGSDEWIIARHIPPGHKLSNVRNSTLSIATWDIPEVYGKTSKKEKQILLAVSKLRRRERIRSHGDGDPVHIDRLTQYIGSSVKAEIHRLFTANYLRQIGDCVELKQTYNGRYRRLKWNTLSPTVDTRFGRIDLFLHPEEHRGMTTREAARLQGFPDNFEFIGSKKSKFDQIGNAVPPPMAATLARFVREAILKA